MKKQYKKGTCAAGVALNEITRRRTREIIQSPLTACGMCGLQRECEYVRPKPMVSSAKVLRMCETCQQRYGVEL